MSGGTQMSLLASLFYRWCANYCESMLICVEGAAVIYATNLSPTQLLLRFVDEFGGHRKEKNVQPFFGRFEIFGGPIKPGIIWRYYNIPYSRVVEAMKCGDSCMKTFTLALILASSTRSAVTASNPLLREPRFREESQKSVCSLTLGFHFSHWGLHRVMTSFIRCQGATHS